MKLICVSSMSGSGPVEAPAAEHTTNATQDIWTHRNFQILWDNPFSALKERGNNYVTRQWTADYFTSVATNIALTSAAFKAVFVSLYHCELFRAGKQFVNALIIGCKALIVEAGNLTKGALGILISTIKTVQQAICFTWYLLGGIAALLVGQPEKAVKYLRESLANLAFIGKDIITMLICLGQAMPPWLPFVLLLICQPAGIFSAVLQLAVKYTGLSDIFAYGGAALLLSVESKMALQTLQDQENASQKNQESWEQSSRVLESWKTLKEELHPCKRNTATVVAFLAARVLIEGVATAVCLFVPGVGSILKYTAYGVEGAIAISLIAARYLHSRCTQKSSKIPEDSVSPRAFMRNTG